MYGFIAWCMEGEKAGAPKPGKPFPSRRNSDMAIMPPMPDPFLPFLDFVDIFRFLVWMPSFFMVSGRFTL